MFKIVVFLYECQAQAILLNSWYYYSVPGLKFFSCYYCTTNYFS